MYYVYPKENNNILITLTLKKTLLFATTFLGMSLLQSSISYFRMIQTLHKPFLKKLLGLDTHSYYMMYLDHQDLLRATFPMETMNEELLLRITMF